MTTSQATYCLLAVGFVLLLIASIGSKSLHEVALHDLKSICSKYRRKEKFDSIYDSFDATALGLETLRTVSFFVLAVAAVMGVGASGLSVDLLDRTSIGFSIAALMGLLCVSIWLPAGIAAIWSAPTLYHGWGLFRMASMAMLPVAWGAGACEFVFRRLSENKDEETEVEAFEEEIRTIVTEGLKDGHLEADAREMIEGVMDLGAADVADIMTPRSQVDMISIEMAWDELMAFVVRVGRTRIPAFDGTADKIVGILYVKDLLLEMQKPSDGRRSIRDLLRSPYKVPRSMKLDDLLKEFLGRRTHLAVVTDEYHTYVGIVTIEDVLEEIVGEIVDESDLHEEIGEILAIDERTSEIMGRAHIAEVNEQLGLDLPEPDDFDTIGGFVTSQLGYVPQAGQSIQWDGLVITVLEANARKVEKVRLEAPDPLNRQTA